MHKEVQQMLDLVNLHTYLQELVRSMHVRKKICKDFKIDGSCIKVKSKQKIEVAYEEELKIIYKILNSDET